MRGRAASSRRELLPVEPRELRTVGRRQRRRRHPVVPALELDLVDVEDVRRARRRLAVVRAVRSSPRRPTGRRRDPRPTGARSDRARARQPADLGRVTRAESEVLKPLLARDERVLVLGSRGGSRSRAGVPRARRRPATRALSRTSTKKTSSDAVCECGGVGSMPGSTRTRFTPTVRVPAAWPSRCHVASISPFARRKESTSSQCANVTAASLADAERHSSVHGASYAPHILARRGDSRGRHPSLRRCTSGRGLSRTSFPIFRPPACTFWRRSATNSSDTPSSRHAGCSHSTCRCWRTAYVDAVATSPAHQTARDRERRDDSSSRPPSLTTTSPAWKRNGVSFYATPRVGGMARAARGPVGRRADSDAWTRQGVMILRLPRTPELDLDTLLTIEVHSSANLVTG